MVVVSVTAKAVRNLIDMIQWLHMVDAYVVFFG